MRITSLTLVFLLVVGLGVASADELIVGDVLLTSLGAATLSLESGVVIVSNIGLSGADGVELTYPPGTTIHRESFFFDNVSIPSGATMQQSVFGTYDGQPIPVLLRRTNTFFDFQGTGTLHTTSFLSEWGPTVDHRAFCDGNLVGAATSGLSSSWIVNDPRPATLECCEDDVDCNGNPILHCWSWDVDGPDLVCIPMTMPGPTSTLVDSMVIEPENLAGIRPVVTSVTIVGGNGLPEIVLSDINSVRTSVGPIGTSVAGAGSAFPNPTSQGVPTIFPVTIRRPSTIELRAYDTRGRLVDHRAPQRFDSVGRHLINWRPAVERSGVYFIEARANGVKLNVIKWVIVD